MRKGRLPTRLAKLERACTRKQVYRGVNPLERIQQWRAYLDGEGPKPVPGPRPPWVDPAAWASRQRLAEYLFTDERPPGLTAAEEAYARRLHEVLDRLEERWPEGSPLPALPAEAAEGQGAS
jgi:hypothetical protein